MAEESWWGDKISDEELSRQRNYHEERSKNQQRC